MQMVVTSGFRGTKFLYSLHAVRGFADYLDIGFAAEQFANMHPCIRNIVNHQDPNGDWMAFIRVSGWLF